MALTLKIKGVVFDLEVRQWGTLLRGTQLVRYRRNVIYIKNVLYKFRAINYNQRVLGMFSPNHILWSLGFRPFYLLAAVWAVMTLPLSVFVILGDMVPFQRLDPISWHMHEMLFGYAAAVIAGFLLTAVQNWTGLATPKGRPLQALVLLWVMGRVGMALGDSSLLSFTDLFFLPVLALIILRLLLKAGNKRNLPVVGILIFLSLVNVAFHLSVHEQTDLTTNQTIYVGLGVLATLMTLIGSRIIYAFTKNARVDLNIIQRPLGEKLFLIFVVLFLGALFINGPSLPVTLSGFGLVITGLVRMQGWKSHKMLGTPLLWILHIGFLWILTGVAFIALDPLIDIDLVVYAVHAITIGAMGSLTLGMMTRSTLGHTGRALNHSKVTYLSYLLINLSAVVRIFPDLIWPEFHQTYIYFSALCWVFVFGLFLVEYTPMLIKKRLTQ